MKILQQTLFFSLLLFMVGCAVDTIEPSLNQEELKAQKHIKASQEEMAAAEQEVKAFEQEWDQLKNTVTVPAGSVDALAAAIEQAGAGGTVILASGSHTENQPVIINKRVKIEGEDGASLLFPNVNEPMGIPKEIVPAIHVKDAERVWLNNFTLSTGSAEASRYGIVIQNSDRTRIESLNIVGFQDGIFIDGGDRCQIIRNNIVGVFDQFPELVHWGITNSSGRRTVMFQNDISNFAVGIFFSDARGLAFSNTVEVSTPGGTIGIIWCTVPAWQAYPEGEFVSAAEPARGWRAYNNTCIGALFNYLIIDGSNSAISIQNESIAAGLYDIEIAGESQRFGFVTPTSTNSLIISVGDNIDARIKDCTGDNTIIGGSLVDTEVDPCF